MVDKTILLVTLPPFRGGVPTKAHILAQFLRSLGWKVTVAYYATLTEHPELVAPSWRLIAGARPSQANGTCWGDFPTNTIGCRFPELEFPYTRCSPPWRQLIAAYDRHIAIGGNPLVGNLLVEAGVRHLLWCAASVREDRMARAAIMPLARKLIDQFIIAPRLAAQERRVLRSGLPTIMGVSAYTCDSLRVLGAQSPRRLPIPTDANRFYPAESPAPVGTLGFAGRLGDPRKRITMLLEAVRILRGQGKAVSLRLAGEAPVALVSKVDQMGLTPYVDFLGHIADSDLPNFYRSLDIFVLPSSQEGLGIVGVEAMACGVPVVCAVRNGGPDDYLIDGHTGLLADSAEDLAQCVGTILEDRSLRATMAHNARIMAVENFSFPAFEEGLVAAWRDTWGDEP